MDPKYWGHSTWSVLNEIMLEPFSVAGVIIFCIDDPLNIQKDNVKVVLVESKQPNNFTCPKGKKEYNENSIQVRYCLIFFFNNYLHQSECHQRND